MKSLASAGIPMVVTPILLLIYVVAIIDSVVNPNDPFPTPIANRYVRSFDGKGYFRNKKLKLKIINLSGGPD